MTEPGPRIVSGVPLTAPVPALSLPALLTDVVVCGAIPKSAAGKILRCVLRRQDAQRFSS